MKNLLSTFAVLTLSASTLTYAGSRSFWSDAGSVLPRSEMKSVDGCYARLHMDRTFDYQILNILGETYVPDIDHAMGVDIEHDINMIEVGPNAIVNLYDNEDFRDYRATIPAGMTFTDHDFLDMVDSFSIRCI